MSFLFIKKKFGIGKKKKDYILDSGILDKSYCYKLRTIAL